MTDSLQNLTYAAFLALYAPLAAGLADPVFHEDAVTERLWQIAVRLGENAKRFNLTAITEPCAVVEKHIVDSLLPLAILQKRGVLDGRMHYVGEPVTLCDIGAGAGFPSLPMAAVLAQSGGRVLAIDATAKKVRYIAETAAALGLSGMTAQSGRAEELARGGLRERFSIVTARAVAELRILMELCAAYVKIGGIFVAMKAHADEEYENAKNAARPLGFDAGETIPYALPNGDARTLVVYRKIKSTEIPYPRPYAKILQKPL